MVVEDTSSSVEFAVETFACRREQTTFGAADKVIKRYLLTRRQVAIFQDTGTITDGCTDASRDRTTVMLAVLARCTLGKVR